MTTYILQFRIPGGDWVNLVDDPFGLAIEFTAKDGAVTIAKELSTADNYPTIAGPSPATWRCIDSHGDCVWIA